MIFLITTCILIVLVITASTIKINEFDVPALENKKLGYTLVGLKDNKGNIDLYICDVKTNNYTLYKEYKSKSSTIYILSDESLT